MTSINKWPRPLLQAGRLLAERPTTRPTRWTAGAGLTGRQTSDIVASFFEKRGLCKVRILGNKMLICYFNFFADNEPHAIEVQHPTNSSLRYTGTVCGNGVHAVVVNF